ncbi:ankyrin repeat-containing protein Yar1p [[Candida] anglica]|uniref:Ankyrin repeat-containing protein Yar1p n=1 Tax=[Candida] anglica TaxID=148631 RepID=A0ABP0E5R8_9ASCO
MASASESVTTLTQEEMDCVILDAREGDLETLTEIFTELSPQLLLTIKDDVTLSTPIHMAAANGHFEVVKYLLSIVDKKDAIALASQQNESGNTPLHWAAFAGHLDVVELLVNEYEVDPFVKNSSGHDSIFEAENNKQDAIEAWFLKKFAVEDYDLKVEEGDNETKITYTPGKESKEADDAAAAAADAAAAAASASAPASTEEIEDKTEKLSI